MMSIPNISNAYCQLLKMERGKENFLQAMSAVNYSYLVDVEKLLVVVGVEALDDVDTDDDVEIELDVETLERKQKRITT